MIDLEREAWITALATYGAGDALTTHYGLKLEGVYESNPAANTVLEQLGSGGMVAVKILVFVIAYAAYQDTRTEWRVGIPIGLSLLGGKG